MPGSVCHKAHGEAAQRSKLNTVTQSYYDGILKAYTPAIDHAWQGRRTVAAAERCACGLAWVRNKRVFSKSEESHTT